MAARRLLIVMLVLLGISSVIAVMVPQPERKDPATGPTATTGQTGTTGAVVPVEDDQEDPADPVARKSVDLDSERPVEIGVATGSRLILTVESKQGSQVEIEGLGLTGFADPYAPAVFDLLMPPEPDRFQVQVPGEKSRAAVLITSRSGDFPVQISSDRAP